jgi:WD40 repeat protein
MQLFVPKMLAAVSCVLAALFATAPIAAGDEDQPLVISVLDRNEPVDFQREVLPILKRNCLACHSAAKPESELVLETPQTILKGGASGPAVTPDKSDESLLLIYAAHIEEPFMPPPDNKVGAVALAPEELGLLKLWIEQGAKGEVTADKAPLAWQPLPPGVNPIYSVALSYDGQYAACGRANQVFTYHLPTRRLVTRLTDPAILDSGIYGQPGIAHLDMVQSLAFHPSGELLASGGYKEVKLWRRPTNVRSLNVATDSPVAAMAASPDGRLLVTGGADHAIWLWDLETGNARNVLRGHSGAVTALQFTADGLKLVSGSADKSLRVWNLADGALAGQFESPQPIAALALLSGGKQIATGGGDNLIRVWDLPSQADSAAEPVEITGHSQPVTSLAALPDDGVQIVSGSQDGTVRHWGADGKQLRELKHGGPVAAVAVRPDGQRVASAGLDKVLKLWNIADGKQLAEIKGDLRQHQVVLRATRELNLAKNRAAAASTALAAAEKDAPAKAEGQKKAAEALAGAEKVVAEKTPLAKTTVEAKALADAAVADTTAAAKAAEETRAAVEKLSKLAAQDPKDELASAVAESLKLATEAKAAAEKASAEATKRAEAVAKPAADAASALAEAEKAKAAAQQAATVAAGDARRAAEELVAAKTAATQTQDVQKKAEAALAAAEQAAAKTEQPWHALAFSPDNLQLAAGAEDKLVQTFSADDGRALAAFEGQRGAILGLAFTGADRLVSGSADKTAAIWNLSPEWTLERAIGGAERSEFADRVVALDFSPDGQLLATGGGEPSRNGEIKIWKVADGTLVRELAEPHSDTVFGLAFSPNGKHLASGSADKFVKVFNVADGKYVKGFEGHTNHVLDVAWQADGLVLASCGADNTIKVWNFETGEQQRTIADFKKQVTSIAFIGDSGNALAASGDGSVRLHRADRGQTVRSFSGASDFVFSTAATYDGGLVIAGGQDSVLRIWNGNDGKQIAAFQSDEVDGRGLSVESGKSK